jgi:hypothetical protein
MLHSSLLTHRPSFRIVLGSTAVVLANLCAAQEPPLISVDAQPLGAQVTRVLQALDYLGQPLSADEKEAITGAIGRADAAATVEAIQKTLDPHCLAVININPESRVKVARGPAAATLVEPALSTRQKRPCAIDGWILRCSTNSLSPAP